MDERARCPVLLPSSNPTESLWQCPPDAIARLRSTPDLPTEADVVIVGSGITGASVAWRLLSENPTSKIVMLEARDACSGATGRNGGHTKAASYRSFLSHVESLGLEQATQIASLELANIKAVHAFAREHSIECDSNPCQTVDVIYDAAQWENAHRAVDAMREAMPGDEASEYTFHSKDEVARRFFCGEGGDEGVCGGVEYAAGSISAYRFGIGALKLSLARGLNLQTWTPAVSVVKSEMADRSSGWLVETPRGTIAAKRVVVAANGYTAALLSKFQGTIVPLRGQITAQRPGFAMPATGLPTTYSFAYQEGYEYMVSRPRGATSAGEIIIGGGLTKAPEAGLYEYGTTDDTTLNPTIQTYLRETLPRYFGRHWGADHAEGRIHKEWTGIMGYSPDGMPFVGEMPGEEGLFVCAGFQGHGMVYCWECARALVEIMGGRDGQTLRGWFPDGFRVKEERFGVKFEGRLHTVAKTNLDIDI